MIPSIRIALVLLAFCVQASRGADWYVEPDGIPTNAGTQDSPWDIASALDGQKQIRAGDTICLLQGVYRRRPKELFEIRLTGTADKPIQIRPANRAHVLIDGGLSMQKPSRHVWIRDLEISVSEPVPEKPVGSGSNPEDLKRPWGGVHMYGGRNCKYINLIIHNCNQGISCWKDEVDPEIYGCIIYDNGWLGTDRGHGHCIYTQNDEGVKVISNCIMSCRYDGTYTLHAYGSSRAYVNNFLVEDNIMYKKGPFLIGGGRPSKNIRVLRNYLYNVDMRIGYDAPYNEDCEIRDNTILNGGLDIVKYQKAVQQGNLVIATDAERPAGAKAILLPNRFDANRAHLAIYNWHKAEDVAVAAGGFLKDGESFRLMNPETLLGKPVAEGICRGGTIRVPLTEQFGVFVAMKNCGSWAGTNADTAQTRRPDIDAPPVGERNWAVLKRDLRLRPRQKCIRKLAGRATPPSNWLGPSSAGFSAGGSRRTL